MAEMIEELAKSGLAGLELEPVVSKRIGRRRFSPSDPETSAARGSTSAAVCPLPLIAKLA